MNEVQTQITNVTGKTVTEGGNVTLKCLAEGNPTPTVMWTRLSDNSVVTMPLTNIRRQNASVGYRCTANNGVKSPATRDVFLDVQYKPDHVSLNMSITNKVCTGMAVTFTCSAGAAKPAIQNYTLYKFVAGLTYISSNQFGIFNQILETGGQHIYRCEARNSPGYTSSSNRTLEVHVSGQGRS
ncbi:igLON family member 5-like isoform X2 [Acropora palmata]|uniref:igLON family member 5-like isoform X2 n=1 Tax=Acropora palmata TaxID=6131 RepID=UPI003DA01B0F